MIFRAIHLPETPTPGQLKDQGIAALLRALAAASHGLCVVTTRYSLPDLRTFWQTTAPEVKLLRLSRDAGVHLLKTLGVREKSGTAQEFATLVEDVKGHALTLTLLGGFLSRAFHGDIRQRDCQKLAEAEAEYQNDATRPYGHASAESCHGRHLENPKSPPRRHHPPEFQLPALSDFRQECGPTRFSGA